MEAVHAATPVSTALAGTPGIGAWRRPIDFAGLALTLVAVGAALLAALAHPGWQLDL